MGWSRACKDRLQTAGVTGAGQTANGDFSIVCRGQSATASVRRHNVGLDKVPTWLFLWRS